MVYKLPHLHSIPSAGMRMRKMAPVLGLLACCAVSPALAGETSPSSATNYATSVQMMNSSVEAQMRALQATLENSRHIDVQTTRLDELIRLQTQQEKVLEKISGDLSTLVQLEVTKLHQDAQTGRARSK